MKAMEVRKERKRRREVIDLKLTTAQGDCDTSKFNIHNITVSDWSGTSLTDVVGNLQCSAASPCTGIVIEDVDLVDTGNGTVPSQYLCDSVEAPTGFSCTGPIVGENHAFRRRSLGKKF